MNNVIENSSRSIILVIGGLIGIEEGAAVTILVSIIRTLLCVGLGML